MNFQPRRKIFENDDVITILSFGKPGVGKSSIGNHILTGDPKSRRRTEQIFENEDVITILSFGKPGVGKSSIGNHILTGDPKSNLFKQGVNFDSYGLTTKIQGQIRTITLPNYRTRKVQYLDIPGVGDFDIDAEKFVNDIKLKYSKTKINIALLVVSAYETPKVDQEVLYCDFYKSFFDQNGLKSKDILYLVITRYQEHQMTDEEISMKLNSLAQDGLEIDPSRVIKYRLGRHDDLKPLMWQISFQNSKFGYNFKNMNEIIKQNKSMKNELDFLTKKIKNLNLENQKNANLITLNQSKYQSTLEVEKRKLKEQQSMFKTQLEDEERLYKSQQTIFNGQLNQLKKEQEQQQSMFQSQLQDEERQYKSQQTIFESQLNELKKELEQQQSNFQSQQQDLRMNYQSEQTIFNSQINQLKKKQEQEQSNFQSQLQDKRMNYQSEQTMFKSRLNELKTKYQSQKNIFQTQLQNDQEQNYSLQQQFQEELKTNKQKYESLQKQFKNQLNQQKSQNVVLQQKLKKKWF